MSNENMAFKISKQIHMIYKDSEVKRDLSRLFFANTSFRIL